MGFCRRQSCWSVMIAILLVVASLATAAIPRRSAVAAAAMTTTPGSLRRAVPTNPVGEQLSWILTLLNDGDQAVTAEALGDHFAADFLNALPLDELVVVLQGVAREAMPLGFGRFEGPVTETRAVAVLTASGSDNWRVSIAVEAPAPHHIVDLFFEPAPRPMPLPHPPRMWTQLDRRLAKLAPGANFLAAEVADGQCLPIHGLMADQPLATGSTFKLYVLGTLAHEIEQGRTSWTEELAVRDDLKSLPSGDMREESAGTEHPLRTYAEQMISASDNTATDHLLFRIGRDEVEGFQTAMGHAEPELNEPFLFTREWFLLKAALPPEQVNAYLKAPPAERRQLLTSEVAHADLAVAESAEWETPRRIDSLEWFSSASDLCRAMAMLQQMGERPGLDPIYDTLSINPGIVFDPATWTYVGYKAGAETGVLNLTWLLRRADGRWFVLSTGFNNPKKSIDADAALRLMLPAARLLAATT